MSTTRQVWLGLFGEIPNDDNILPLYTALVYELHVRTSSYFISQNVSDFIEESVKS